MAREGTVSGGLAEAEEYVAEACALLVRADLSSIELAAGHLSRAADVLSGPGKTGETASRRRKALHQSIQRAGELLDALGRWCEHRRMVLFPEEGMPACYGADGRETPAVAADTLALEG